MKGNSGNLIYALKKGHAVKVDGPAVITIKEIKGQRVVVMVNGDDETKIKHIKEPVEMTEHKEAAKE